MNAGNGDAGVASPSISAVSRKLKLFAIDFQN